MMNSHSRYGTALALLLVAYVLDAFNGPLVQYVVALTYVMLLLVLLFDSNAARWTKIVGLTLVAVSTLTSGLSTAISPAPFGLGLGSLFLDAMVIGLAIAVVLRRISGHERVNLSTVLGAVLAYTLLAFLFSSIYQAIDMLAAQPFFAQGEVGESDFLYFSFVTLTTLGYGDLSPALELAKRLIVLEALMGEVFLVVLVARMVSLWRRSDPPPETTQVDSPDPSST